jgi:hypothetical protein
MVAKLTVVFFIVLCFQVGILLTLLPWFSWGVIGDWGDNYFLSLISKSIGSPVVQQIVSSGWVRGAVSSIGILNLIVAFWEVFSFGKTVKSLDENAQQ